MTLISNQTLPRLRLQYNDFSVWQNSEEQKQVLFKQKTYWKKQLAGEIPVLDLPTDYIRPAIQRFEGGLVTTEINPVQTDALQTLVLSEGVTLYMALLSIYYIFLFKLANQEDILVGTPIAGRRHTDLEKIIGMFVNTLVLRNYPSGNKTFREFLKEIKTRWLEVFENQDYPYEELVEEVSAPRDTSRNPLFDTMFVMQNLETPRLKIPGLQLAPYEYQIETSKFDLTLIVMEVENKLQFTFEYSTNLFKKITLDRYINYLKKIVSTAIADPDVKLCDIEILSKDEKKKILSDFNNTTADFPYNKTVHHLFSELAEQSQDHIAVIGPSLSLETINISQMTYKQLNEKSGLIAHLLIEKGVGPDFIIGVKLERSIEMVVGIMAILKAGAAYLPIEPDYPEERINYMLADSSAKILLTSNEINSSKDHSAIVPPSTSTFQVDPTNLAYVIYTSGTTGRPKGVLVNHRNTVNVVTWFARTYRIESGNHILQLSAYTFDASVNQIFGPLICGAVLYVLPKDMLTDMEALRTYILTRNIHLINFVPLFLYELLCGEESVMLDSIQTVISGAEKLDDSIKNKILARGYRLYNHYGPTEATIDALAAVCSDQAVKLGKPISNAACYILDPYFNLAPIGVAGELVVSGTGLARGYLNRPELTAEKFFTGYNWSDKYYRFYRTGDLACWLPNGDIDFLGRIDHQVKIRGFRIEVGEIENRLLSHQQIEQCAVIPVEDKNGDKFLCGYIIPRTGALFDGSHTLSMELKRFLSHSLPAYMIPSYFMELDELPLTPTGKINRKSLPEPEHIRIREEYTPPRNDTENKLVEIWEEELGTAPIGIHDNFFDVGGHSLKAIGLVNKIHKQFGVKISVRDLFRFSTISTMVPLIQYSEISGFQKIEKQPEKPYYEMSYAQKRLWYIIKRDPYNTSFNMPGIISLEEAVDEVVLLKVLQLLIQRHEGFRTSFKEIKREPVQVIEPTTNIKPVFQVVDWTGLKEEEQQDRLLQSLFEESSYIFDLKEAPLLRIKLIKCKTDQCYLLFNIHHIISDGWSIEILKKEFNRFFQAAREGLDIKIPKLEIQYKDYAAWQNQLVASEEQTAGAREFWRDQLAGVLPILNLPYDFSAHTDNKESAAYRWVIPEELTNRLRKMGVDHRASLFMVLLAGFNLLLAQVTGQKDIIMAIPAAARQHDELKEIIGIFVNTLILRNTINNNDSFDAFFEHIRDNTFKVLEYQSFPLELICGQLKIKYPVISVFFNMINIESTHQEILTNSECYHLEKVQDAKFDIVCYLIEYKNGIEISPHYFKHRFKPNTIETLMDLYTRILEAICRDPRQKIWQLGVQGVSGEKKILKRKIKKKR
jgi:amino acid adenylation domain-containing protein